MNNRAGWPSPDPLPQPAGGLCQIAGRVYGCAPQLLHPLCHPSDAVAWLQARGLVATADGTDVALIENPDRGRGGSFAPARLAELARGLRHLIVDESGADARPDLSLIPDLPENVTVLRDMRPFWGVPLAFAVSHQPFAGAPVPNAQTRHLAALALADSDWACTMTVWLAEAALYLDQIMTEKGARFIGGTHLFRLYALPDADRIEARLARHRIRMARPGPDPDWLRAALPRNLDEFARLREALS